MLFFLVVQKYASLYSVFFPQHIMDSLFVLLSNSFFFSLFNLSSLLFIVNMQKGFINQGGQIFLVKKALSLEKPFFSSLVRNFHCYQNLWDHLQNILFLLNVCV